MQILSNIHIWVFYNVAVVWSYSNVSCAETLFAYILIAITRNLSGNRSQTPDEHERIIRLWRGVRGGIWSAFRHLTEWTKGKRKGVAEGCVRSRSKEVWRKPWGTQMCIYPLCQLQGYARKGSSFRYQLRSVQINWAVWAKFRTAKFFLRSVVNARGHTLTAVTFALEPAKWSEHECIEAPHAHTHTYCEHETHKHTHFIFHILTGGSSILIRTFEDGNIHALQVQGHVITCRIGRKRRKLCCVHVVLVFEGACSHTLIWSLHTDGTQVSPLSRIPHCRKRFRSSTATI